MLLIFFIQCVIVITLLVASRRRVEDAIPLMSFYLVLMPLESRFVIPGLCDFNTMRLSLLTMLAVYVCKKKPANPAPLPLTKLMGLHIVWVVVSTIYSISTATSAKQVLSQTLEYYLLYFLLVKSISRVETIHKTLYAMVLAMGLCSVLALTEVFASWSILRIFPSNLWITYNGGIDPIYIEAGRGLRVRSTFAHPILFGDALAMTIPLTIYLISISKGKGKRLLLWMSLVMMFYADYRTTSRGPWLGTSICLVLLLIMVKTGIKKYILSLGMIIAIVLVTRPGVLETMTNLYQATNDPNSPTGTSYIYRHALSESVHRAVQTDTTRMLFGYGLGTFREIGLDIDFMGEVDRSHTCDDNWALFLYETGYGGVIIMCALLGTAMFLPLRDYFRLRKPERYLSGVLFISLLGFNFLMLSVAAYAWGQQSYMNWIFISLAVSVPRVVSLQERSERGDRQAISPPDRAYDLEFA
jgi:hypothetical protein